MSGFWGRSGIGYGLLAALLLAAPMRAEDESDGLDRLMKQHGIELCVAQPPASSWAEVSFKAITLPEQRAPRYQAYRELLAQELGKYPHGLFQLANLQRICLVQDLAIEVQPGKKKSGKRPPKQLQKRAALPDFVQEILYLDVRRGHVPAKGVKLEGFRGRVPANLLYQRHVVHHEFFHLLMEEVYGDPYAPDPDWSRLNPAGFPYGKGGAAAQKGIQYALVHPAPGFINRYSLSGLEEDKCEIFAALMLPDEAGRIMRWSQDDPWLRGKILAMKAFLASRVPALDAAFWQGI